MEANTELGRNSVVSTRFSQSMEISRSNPSRETKSSGENVDREKIIFPVQLTTIRIGNLIRLIHTLAVCVTIHTSIHKKS